MNNVVETIDFLSKKVKLSIEELNQPLTKSKREELIEYQDRLMDSLFEEVDKLRESKDVETLESLSSKLQEIERLAIHEITVHAFRGFNGELIEKQTKLPLKNKWPNYLATEEGLASFIEIQSGYKDTNTLRKYAGRLLAVDAAFNGESFNQIFDLLVSYQFRQSEAFDIVWRCFRRGGYLKDGEYWKGLQQIQNIHDTNPERIKKLFAGKVAHQHFHLVEDQIPQELYDQLKLPVCLR